MDDNQKATETNAANIAPQGGTEVTVPTEDDLEARLVALEAEKKALEGDKNAAIEREANYKLAYLKEREKNKSLQSGDSFEEEGFEEKVRRIAEEALTKSRISEINKEQEELTKRILRENKELKLANLNKMTASPGAAVGSHTESVAVNDNIVTPQQIAALKARGRDDKKIEAYKANLRKHS